MRHLLAVLALLTLTSTVPLAETASGQSGKGAFFRSLVLPGWGHHYAHGGRWGRSGAFFALADASLVLGATSAGWQRSSAIESYETLAASRAGADLAGKDRTFYLRLASYRSSDEFREISLRNRAWDQIAYVDDPAFQWAWASDADFVEFGRLREESESLGRRRTVLIATAVANRFISGISAARSARRGRAASTAVSMISSPAGTGVSLRAQF